MDFFNSLTLDVKMLIVGIAGCALLALFSGNRKAEQRYLLVLALLTMTGVYRFERTSQAAETSAAAEPSPHFITVTTKHKALESTSAK